MGVLADTAVRGVVQTPVETVTAGCEVVGKIGTGRYRPATTVTADGEQVIDGEAAVVRDPLP